MERRTNHPRVCELVEGLDLQSSVLRVRADFEDLRPLIKLLENAEYWLSFDLANFEPLLEDCPSPLRELGVGITLRYADRLDGTLDPEALAHAREDLLSVLAEDLKPGLAAGMTVLERALLAQKNAPQMETQGFSAYRAPGRSTAQTLRATSTAQIEGESLDLGGSGPHAVALGEPFTVFATGARDRRLSVPEIESDSGAQVLSRDNKQDKERTFYLTVPGYYRLRVPGVSFSEKSLLAR